MPFSLSFSPDFFTGATAWEDIERSDRPECVLQAIFSMNTVYRAAVARDVFGCEAGEVSDEAVLQKVIETDTCGSLTAPVDVWIDSAGYYRLHIHDRRDG